MRYTTFYMPQGCCTLVQIGFNISLTILVAVVYLVTVDTDKQDREDHMDCGEGKCFALGTNN
jgi:hypothetical protein